jgi:hypothetical protein
MLGFKSVNPSVSKYRITIRTFQNHRVIKTITSPKTDPGNSINNDIERQWLICDIVKAHGGEMVVEND